MATLAAIAEVAVVHIVTLVAAAASRRRHHLFVHGLAVTGVALVGSLLVRPIQLEVGLVVVEVPSFPRTRRVANLTFGSQPATVDLLIIILMA